MAKYRRIPTIIEAVEFRKEPDEEFGDIWFLFEYEDGLGWRLYNRLYDSWVKVKPGDFVRIDLAPEHVYPIDRERFFKTHEPIDGKTPRWPFWKRRR